MVLTSTLLKYYGLTFRSMGKIFKLIAWIMTKACCSPKKAANSRFTPVHFSFKAGWQFTFYLSTLPKINKTFMTIISACKHLIDTKCCPPWAHFKDGRQPRSGLVTGRFHCLFGPHVFVSGLPPDMYVLYCHTTILQSLCGHAFSTDIYKSCTLFHT